MPILTLFCYFVIRSLLSSDSSSLVTKEFGIFPKQGKWFKLRFAFGTIIHVIFYCSAFFVSISLISWVSGRPRFNFENATDAAFFIGFMVALLEYNWKIYTTTKEYTSTCELTHDTA